MMSRWPVEKPPIDPNPPRINLLAKPSGPPDPLVFNGPLNELIALEGIAQAYVATANVKEAYDEIVPTPAPPAPKGPAPSPGIPISAGHRVDYQPTVECDDISDVVSRHRHRPPRLKHD